MSFDFLDWVGFDQCHAERVLKTAAYPEIADAQVVEKIASDVHATDGNQKKRKIQKNNANLNFYLAINESMSVMCIHGG